MKKVALLFLIFSTSIPGAAAQDFGAEFSLRRVITTVMQQNPDVRAAAAAYAAARGRLLTQQAPLPDPFFVADYEGLTKPLALGGYGERTIGIVQPLEFPLKWVDRKAVAGKEAQIAEMNLELVKLALSAAARKAYSGVLARERDSELANENVALAQDFLKKASVRFEAGDVRRIEVLRAKIGVAGAELETVRADKDLLLAKANLNLLMARDAHALLNITGVLTFAPLNFELESLQTSMLESHPQIRAFDYAVAGNRSAVRLSKLEYVPDLELGLLRQTTPGEDSFWSVGIGFEIPLWFPYRQRGGVNEAKANLALAQAELAGVRNDLILGLETAYHELHLAERQVRVYTGVLLEEAEEVNRIASRSYEEGEAGYLEVLEAQRVLRTTRTQYVQALFEYNSALADLELAVGGGLIPAGA